MAVVVPTLSDRGWISAEDTNAQLVQLFSHAWEADYNQSNDCPRGVFSIPYLGLKYGQNPIDYAEALQEAMETYYRLYYPTAVVEVDASSENESYYDLVIYIAVTVNGQNYTLNDAIRFDTTDQSSRLVSAINRQ